jgi:hypothetical protein
MIMKKTHLSVVGAAAAGLVLLTAGALHFINATCPQRVVSGGAPWFKPYHVGDNPWVGASPPEGASIAAPNTPDLGGDRRLAEHSGWTDSCERKTETAKPGLSS